MIDFSPFHLTMAEASEGIRRIAAIAATLPKIEERKAWFWQRASLERDGWSVMSGWPVAAAYRVKAR